MELDDKWIHEFENNDKLYKDFYKDDLYYISLKIIYINENNEIDKIKSNTLFFKTKNTIHYEEIIKILKTNAIENNIKYKLLSMLKYNINLEPNQILNYLEHYHTTNYNFNFLSIIKNIDTIYFDQSITMFHDLNEFIIVFYQDNDRERKSNNYTKKNYFA